VVLSEDTLVMTLYGALTPAEQALAATEGVGPRLTLAVVRQFLGIAARGHQAEYGRELRGATSMVETATDAVVQVLTTRTMTY